MLHLRPAPSPIFRGAWWRSLALGLLLGTAPALAQDDDEPIIAYPEVLTYIEASYPADALAQGLEAEVTLLVELDEQGKVTYVEVMESTSTAFDAAAMAAVRQMRFTPAKTANGPVGVAFPFVYSFKLPEAPGGEPAEGEDVAPDDLPIIEGPKVVDYVEAPYPPEAEAAGAEGKVTLLVTLTEEGVVEEVVVTGPAGQGFDLAALEAVKAMTFAPARTEAGPVGVMFEFEYAFTLTPEEPEPDKPAPVNLQGRIRQMGTRRPVAGATIVVSGTELDTKTDTDGRFEIRGVPAGTQMLRVLHPEHVTIEQEIEVIEGELLEAQFWLRSLSYRDNEAVGYYRQERQEVTRRTLSIEEVKRIPGTFGDPVKVIQTLPGAARSPFGTGLLIIRGANPEDSAVYVDGVRIPIVYHLTGTTSVLSPEIVQAVDYLPGGYGVQYGRSAAGTVNVKTKEKFDDSKFVWGTDILDSQLWYEGNLGKNKQHGFAIGARRSYIDVFIPLFTADLGFQIRPIYWDYQLKWIPELGDKTKFSAFVYGFQDTLRISTPEDVAQGTDQDTQGDFRTSYQAHRLVLRFQHEFTDTFRIDLRPSIGIDINDIALGDSFRLFNRNILFQLRAEAPWLAHPAIELIPGLDIIGGPYYFDFRSPLSFDDLDDPLAERDPIGFDGRGSAWSPTPYFKANFRPLADREQWLITPGIRLNNVSYKIGGSITDGADVDPTRIRSVDLRFATRLRVFEKGDQNLVLKGSSGTYHQPPQPFESIGLGTTATLRAESAWNSSFGLEHRITPAISWNIEGFYRKMDRLIEFSDGFTGGGTQPFENSGEGYAAGFELMLRHAPANRFFGWISYTFSRSFRRSVGDDRWVPFDFDQPHIFSAQGGYDLPFDLGVSAQVQVVSGNPETPFNAGVYDVDSDSYIGFSTGQSNSTRLPTFVQTSFRVDKKWTFRKFQLVTYLDLINAIRGVNPETTIYNYDYSEYAYVRGLPFIPNLGIEILVHP